MDFNNEVKRFLENYPNFSKDEIEKKAKILGGYKFFELEYPLINFNHKKFLEQLHLPKIDEVVCEQCGRKFNLNDYKGGSLVSIFKRHKIKCDKYVAFIKKYSWTKEKLNKEIDKLTVQDFIKKYPELNGDGYNFLKSFGIDTSMKRSFSKVDKKKRQNNLIKYGVEHNFSKNHPSRQCWETRLWENEGIKNVFQRESVKKKIKEVLQQKYGDGITVPFKCKAVVEKAKQNYFNKTGYYHHMQNPEFLEKYFKNMLNKFGFETISAMNKSRFHGIVFSHPHKVIVDILTKNNISVKTEFAIYIDKNTLNKEKMNKYYYQYDILIENKKILIEVNGDYWHANPIKYNKDDILNFFGKNIRVSDIWERDKIKTNFAISNGYDIITIWEYDINNNFDKTTKDLINFINGKVG